MPIRAYCEAGAQATASTRPVYPLTEISDSGSFHTQATVARAATACPTLRPSSRTAVSSGFTGAMRCWCQARPPRCRTRLVELAALALLVPCLG